MVKKKKITVSDEIAVKEGESDALAFYRKLDQASFAEWWTEETGEELNATEAKRLHSRYLDGYAEIEKSIFLANVANRRGWDYVSDLPEGRADWGYVGTESKALMLTYDQAYEFYAYQRDLGRRAIIVRLSQKQIEERRKNPTVDYGLEKNGIYHAAVIEGGGQFWSWVSDFPLWDEWGFTENEEEAMPLTFDQASAFAEYAKDGGLGGDLGDDFELKFVKLNRY